MTQSRFGCDHLFVCRVDTGSTETYSAIGPPLLLDVGNISANEVELTPEDDQFQLHVISTTNALEVGPLRTQPHSKNEDSYIMTHTGLRRTYERRTSYVLYLYYSTKIEECLDDKHIVDISIENVHWDATLQIKSDVVNILGTATEPVSYTYLGYANEHGR